uniref:Nuclear protein 1 n=1 Tax=Sinocyclocheilus grahami TaxID=75366 RepID=A0A672RMN7_SINGR
CAPSVLFMALEEEIHSVISSLPYFSQCASRKGRTKKEASCNTNRPNPAGHERKIVEKLQNAEKKSKE